MLLLPTESVSPSGPPLCWCSTTRCRRLVIATRSSRAVALSEVCPALVMLVSAVMLPMEAALSRRMVSCVVLVASDVSSMVGVTVVSTVGTIAVLPVCSELVL